SAVVVMFVVTGSNGVRYEQLPDDGEQRCAVQLCVTNLFWTVKSKFCAVLVLPNTSTANADTVTGLLNTVVDGQDAFHAGIVPPFLPLAEVLEAPVSTCMKRVPF